MIVVCPACAALNRVPDDRLRQQPQCGTCAHALLDGRPHELGDAGFQRFIDKSELPVLVDFWAPWCGPCRAMAPAFEQAAAELRGKAVLVKVNTEDNPQTAVRWRIRSIPTLLLLRGGAEVRRQAGAMPARELVRWSGL